MGRVVLVTGVSMDLGRRFARQLTTHPDVERVIGVDVLPPRGDSGTVQFVRADIRNPVIGKVIAREQVDTVVHMSVIASPGTAGGRTSMKELNVIGTMQLLAAAQESSTVQHLVVKSSAAFYGSSGRDPAMFTEAMSPKRQPVAGYAKDVVEVESYVRGFARRRPDVTVTTLRAANVIGPLVTSPITTYFRLPVIPTVLGHDARLQWLHEHDLLGVLQQATLSPVAGTFNVAGDGLMMLSQAIRRTGRPSVKVPSIAMGQVSALVRRARLADFSTDLVPFLTYGRGLDTTRMRELLGFRPRYTTAEAFADFATSLAPGLFSSGRVEDAERVAMAVLSGGSAGSLPTGRGGRHA